MRKTLTFALPLFAFAMPAVAQIDYGPGAKPRIPRRVYWGDTHLHTSFSPDASLGGNVKLGPAISEDRTSPPKDPAALAYVYPTPRFDLILEFAAVPHAIDSNTIPCPSRSFSTGC